MHGRSGDLPPQTSRSATQPEVSFRTDDRARQTLALTVVAHPCLERVGDQALLHQLERPGNHVHITRREPLFFQPRRELRRPLGDPFLSRSKPLILRPTGKGGVLLDASACARSVLVDGREVRETTLDRERLESGVVLLLSRRVVLLLHTEQAVTPRLDKHLGLVGESAAIVKARNDIVDAAQSLHPVLIRGQSGTGKDVVARAVHRLSGREPFAPVNLSMFPTTLIAAELFGAEKGAYAGLRERRKGEFRQADGGTLFLDELGDVPLEVQPMLFRVLEDRMVRPLGTETHQEVDVRFIAATDRDLEAAVDAGEFRPQLFYRLRDLEIHLPPVVERKQDIGRLLVYLLSKELESEGRVLDLHDPSSPWFPGEMVNEIALHPLPGNVRDLRKIVKRLVIVGRRQEWCPDPRELIEEVDELLARSRPLDSTRGPAWHGRAPSGNQRLAAEIPCEELVSALASADGSVSEAARRLGIGRTSFYKQWGERCKLKTSETLLDDELTQAWETCGGDVAQLARWLGVPKRGLFKRLKRLGLR